MNAKDCIFFQLAKTSRIGIRFWSKKMSHFNITAVQGLVLAFLAEEDKITSSHLGKRVQLDSATLTGIIDRLEHAKLINRKNKPGDRRAVLICLTDEGKRVSKDVRMEAFTSNAFFLSKLTYAEQETLLLLLGKLSI